MLQNRGALFAVAGGFIALLAVLEIVDQDATVWNVLSLVIGVVLFVWGLANARRPDR
jgi:DMSO reductase anchor subunit